MPSKHQQKAANEEIGLEEVANRYLASISNEKVSEVQQEIFKFIRWFGGDRKINTLTGREIANYSEQFFSGSISSNQHLNAVKLFLIYAYKNSLIQSNLAVHIRTKKNTVKNSPAVTNKEEPIIMTIQGYEELQRKLTSLKEQRPKIVDEIKKAALDKDFRENAPLQAAREKQAHIEGQIKDIENTLKRAKIIQPDSNQDLRVSLGDKVTLEDLSTGERITYMIVGSKEADIKQGKISVVSPIGQAMYNQEIGAILKVNAPSTMLKYKILKISKTS